MRTGSVVKSRSASIGMMVADDSVATPPITGRNRLRAIAVLNGLRIGTVVLGATYRHSVPRCLRGLLLILPMFRHDVFLQLFLSVIPVLLAAPILKSR